MKRTLPCIFLGIVGSFVVHSNVNAQTDPSLPDISAFNHQLADVDLLAELNEEYREPKKASPAKSLDLKIKASRLHVDLKNERQVEFSANTGWATDFVWKFGDGSTMSGFQHVKHEYRKPGKYEITLLASNKEHVARQTIEIDVVDNSQPLELEEMQHFIVFPSDNKLEADIQLNLPKREKHLLLEIKNIEGERVFEYEVGKVRKTEIIHVDLQNLDAGKYYAILKGKKYSLASRLTVAR
jgi:hypothetical protein